MTQAQRQTIPIEVAAVSDRGLNPKRPLNEDSYLSDANRRLFIVADGVGGAQAGEVASQTAVEVLDEAFLHQLSINDDVEDLMEIAVQRANNSIYQMAHEHPKFSAMATTVVLLHLDGLTATIGHVGDSRLYRLAPDGRLYRETQDHSVVEEEVRAGRMTQEQAVNHPSRNVISRALGADANVDVEMKTIRFEDGTAFLLCSDGITRHISDPEIRELLGSRYSLEKVCAELKRRCYERGAEDNLTAIAVRAGGLFNYPEDDERTVSTARVERPEDDDYRAAQVRPSIGAEPQIRPVTAELSGPVSAPIKTPRRKSGILGKLFMFLLFVGGFAVAFAGGMALRERFVAATGVTVPVLDKAQPIPSPTPDAQALALAQNTTQRNEFLQQRAVVDQDPAAWLAQRTPAPVGETPETLYLRGRALLMTDKTPDAIVAFEQTLAQMPAESSPSLLRMEAQASLLRAKAVKQITADDLRQSLDTMIGLSLKNGKFVPVTALPATNATPAANGTPLTGASPATTPKAAATVAPRGARTF